MNKLNFKQRPVKDNLTPEERSALTSLRQRADIVIKPTDKGGAVVVWDRNLYQEEAERQLSDTTFYEKLDRDFTMDYNKTICEVVKAANTKDELPASAVNLVVENPRTSSFYMLPKIHKPGNPGRPIVSACNCPTELIAPYLDRITTPLVQSLPSYVKDTNHMLRIADSFRFPGTSNYVFTMDVMRWPLGTDAFSQQKTGPATTHPYSGPSSRTGPYIEHILFQWEFLSSDGRGRDGEPSRT